MRKNRKVVAQAFQPVSHYEIFAKHGKDINPSSPSSVALWVLLLRGEEILMNPSPKEGTHSLTGWVMGWLQPLIEVGKMVKPIGVYLWFLCVLAALREKKGFSISLKRVNG